MKREMVTNGLLLLKTYGMVWRTQASVTDEVASSGHERRRMGLAFTHFARAIDSGDPVEPGLENDQVPPLSLEERRRRKAVAGSAANRTSPSLVMNLQAALLYLPRSNPIIVCMAVGPV